MTTRSRSATRDVAALARGFRRKNRPEAIRNLLAAPNWAMQKIADNPIGGLSAPRPYPGLAQPGGAWIKVGRYWFAYSLDNPPVIIAVFHDAADIPRRK